ncbi:MAG: alpha/beta hydrolase [Flavobacteriaceae bacterium]|nr:alpha/beta hydrolase [Flavobacteriaceae bacterium]
MKKLFYFIPFVLLFSGCFANIKNDSVNLVEYDFTLFDNHRNRPIPIHIYDDKTSDDNKKVVIFNHGYGFNRGESYKTYSKLYRFLASNGYFVISIQHELPTDDLLAMDGNLYETRMPNWQKGVKNIEFVLAECKKIYQHLDWKNVSLIGHSNGGDMAMLFITEHPELIKNAVSLDNRRVPIPRISEPRILSLRGTDFPADFGVIPTADEQTKYGIEIVYLADIQHSDMDDKGTQKQSEEIKLQIIRFLRGK